MFNAGAGEFGGMYSQEPQFMDNNNIQYYPTSSNTYGGGSYQMQQPIGNTVVIPLAVVETPRKHKHHFHHKHHHQYQYQNVQPPVYVPVQQPNPSPYPTYVQPAPLPQPAPRPIPSPMPPPQQTQPIEIVVIEETKPLRGETALLKLLYDLKLI